MPNFPWSAWQSGDENSDYLFTCPNCNAENLLTEDQFQDGFRCYKCDATIRLETEHQMRARVFEVKADA